MSKRGLLIVISGPSGAGKGTLCEKLREKNPDIKISVSVTTRPPRNGEKHGINYFFITKEEFYRLREEDKFLEWAEVYGNFYGTLREHVEEVLNRGEDIILEIDIQGALKIKEKCPEGVFIFIIPPTMEELKRRIKKRATETEEEILKRFQSAFRELNYITRYNYIVINDQIDEAVKRLEAIIIAEKCRVDRNRELYLNLLKEGSSGAISTAPGTDG